MNKDNIPYGPFKLWTIENFPFIEADFDAITNYQLYSKIVEYLRKIAENQAEVNETVNYMLNYFNNLDVQDEINNKLDEMAESGQLTDIIAQYLQLAGVLAYDTISAMSDAENITEGSTCYTLGQNTYNDGKGAFYKIRTITSGDTVDGYNIVALDVSDTLIAERIPDYRVSQLETNVNSINNTLNIIRNKKVIIVGDSYANRTNSWADRVKAYSGLGNNCVIKKYSGVGFYNTVDSINFSTLVVDDIPFTGTEVTDIIVCGGYNDQFCTEEQLTTAFNNFVSVCNTNYPNAKIFVGFISWCKPGIEDYATKVGALSITRQYYINLASQYKNVYYLNNVEYSLHLASEIDSSYFHPTEDGQYKISLNVMRAWLTGSCNVNSQQLNITSSFTITNTAIENIGSSSFYGSIENNISRLFTGDEVYLDFDETTSVNLSTDITIGTFSNGYVFGRSLTVDSCPATCLINTKNNGYFIVPATVFISEGTLKLRCKTLNRTGNGWITDSLKYITINGLNMFVDSMLQY